MNLFPDDLKREFAEFYAAFPKREAKLNAEREYRAARKRASAADILAGAHLYAQHCSPERRYIQAPDKWLRAGRWEDEYDDPAPTVERESCRHDPPCNSPQWHLVRLARERGEVA